MSGSEEWCYVDLQERSDIFQAQELGHLGPLVHISGVDGGGIQGHSDVAEQDAVSEGVGQVLDGGSRPHDPVIGREDLQTTKPIGALLPKMLTHSGRRSLQTNFFIKGTEKRNYYDMFSSKQT